MASPRKLSGMQRQVLALYRCFLRAARLKSIEQRQRIVSVVSSEFHYNADNVDRKNFQYIEYLLRRGKRQLEQLESSTTISLSSINVIQNSGFIKSVDSADLTLSVSSSKKSSGKPASGKPASGKIPTGDFARAENGCIDSCCYCCLLNSSTSKTIPDVKKVASTYH